MIIILHQRNDENLAQAIANNIKVSYDQLDISILLAEEGVIWPGKISWDDLLIVVFNNTVYPEFGRAFIHEYICRTNKKGFILPIARNNANKIPPEPIDCIKALIIDDSNDTSFDKTLQQIIRRVGALMGLCLRNYDCKIFISYRTTDGSEIAQKLDSFLQHQGFQTWRDEAREPDGEAGILPGEDVEKTIEEKLKTANLVLLIDTPHASESPWIQKEINIANSLMIPIFPVCIRSANGHRRGPRFSALENLQRGFRISNTDYLDDNILGNLLSEIEDYLQEIYKRKLRVPHVVEHVLKNYGFDWKPLDREKYSYESIKRLNQNLYIKWRILSHCSIYDEIYKPNLQAFVDFLKKQGCGYKANFKLYIYDGDVIPSEEIEQIVNIDNDFLILIHTQELLHFLSTLPSCFQRSLP